MIYQAHFLVNRQPPNNQIALISRVGTINYPQEHDYHAQDTCPGEK